MSSNEADPFASIWNVPEYSINLDPTGMQDYVQRYEFPFCAESSKYVKMAKIGEGSFGEVFKAREKTNPKKFVAMKRILINNEKDGFPVTSLREIKILQRLRHENVVNLIEICHTKASQDNGFKTTFYLVFEFCEHDLRGLISNANVNFNLGEIKQVMRQLFRGLHYIHTNKIFHRDLKAANILITKQGILKLADFGLARPFSYLKEGEKKNFTNCVITLWYRPPELLLGDRNYGPKIDMWSAGCIMAELWTRTPILQGDNEQHQLHLISKLCGSLTPDVWPGVENFNLYKVLQLPKIQNRRVKERLKPYVRDPLGCDLLDKLLVLDPKKRFNAESALDHDFFYYDPEPTDLRSMLKNHYVSMFAYLQQQTKNTIPQDNGFRDQIW